MKKSVKAWIAGLLTVGIAGVATGVVAQAVSESKESSTPIATESEYAPSKALKNVRGCTFESGVKSPDETLEEYTGVKVTSVGSASFRYNGLCDLRENGDFISFIMMPDEMGTAEIDSFVITLTDAYDSSKYITMNFYDGYRSNYPMATWVSFSESGKYTPFGYEYNGEKLTVGTSIACSWRGVVANNQGNTIWQQTNFYYDVDEKAIFTYAHNALGSDGLFTNGYQDYQTKKLLFDFDDEKYLDTNIFEGFTTDEVYITVDVTSNVNAHLLVTKLGGVDLSGDELPSKAPEISIDYQGYDQNDLPYGVACDESSYPVFDAIAYSPIDGEFEPQEISVLYGTENVPIVNGRFATKKAGVYTVNYTAASVRGESTRKSVRVLVKNDYVQTPSYAVNSDIPSEAYVGEDKVYLPDGKAGGGSGNLDIVTTLACGGEEVEILTKGNAKYFVPQLKSDENEATYVLAYTIEDITGRKTIVEKNIIVKRSDRPIIDTVSVPAVIRRDYVTTFASTTAIFVDGDEKITVPVKIRVNGTFLNGCEYTPTTLDTLTLEYVAYHPEYPDDETRAAIERYEVEVLALHSEKSSISYFLVDGMEYLESLSTSVLYSKTAENATFTYANVLSASSLSLVFDMQKNASEGFSITVRDSVNPVEKIVFSVENRLGLPALFVGDTMLGALGGSMVVESAQQMKIVYDNYAYSVYGRNDEYIGTIAEYSNGLPFEGFTSGAVYVEFSFDERTDIGANFWLYSLNGHTFSWADGDKKSPDISLNHSLPTLRYEKYGSQVLVSGATARDVFGSVESLTVKITAPNKSVVYEGAIDEDYTYTANLYGTYNIVYTAVDDSNKKTTLRTAVCIADTEAPTIENKISFKAQYSVGEKITLPKITAKDNKDENVSTYFVVILPTGEWKTVSTASYTFSIKGDYKIRAVAVDEALNTTYVEFAVKVV